MFEGDSADMCAGKFLALAELIFFLFILKPCKPLSPIGGVCPAPLCTDPPALAGGGTPAEISSLPDISK